MTDLPTGWTYSNLETATKVIRGITFPATAKESVQKPENVCCLRTANIQTQIDWGNVYYVDRKYVKRKEQLVQAGDILMSMANSYELVGKVAHVRQVPSPTAFGAFLSAVRPTEIIDGRYLFHFLRLDRVQQELRDGSSQTTNIANISVGRLNSIEVPLAPMAEQARIADRLESLLARINNCGERLGNIPKLLKRFRHSVLDAATLGLLTADWRLEHNAEAWTTVLLRDIAHIVGGVTKDSKKQSSKDEEVPYLRVANVQRGYIDLREVKTIRVPEEKLEKLLLQTGDVLFNEGGDLDKLGRGWVWEGQINRCTFQNHVFRARLLDSRNQPKYISWWGNTRGLDFFIRSGKQTTNLASINKTMLEALPISLPSPSEQIEIVRRVDALLIIADQLERNFSTASAQAQRLIPLTLAKAFRGELVQQNPQDEPASILLQRIAGKQPAEVRATRGRPRGKKPETVEAVRVDQPDWSTLPSGAWAAQVPADEHTATAQLTAVLKAWGKPMPQDTARLATLLCLHPRLLTAALPAEHATQWRRLVGDAAAPLPAQVVTLQPAFNIPWRNAISKMRARGDLVETGSGVQGTWALGPDAARVDTVGWPEGRAGWVVHYLQTHGVEAVLPTLATEVQEFVHARAA